MKAMQKVEALMLLGARELLKTDAIYTSAHPAVFELDQRLGKQSKELSMLFSRRTKEYSNSIRALDWLASIIGKKITGVDLKRSGKQLSKFMLTEKQDAVDVAHLFQP